MLRSIIFLAICATLVAGCAGRETDPRKAGFVSSVLNQTDGTNERRLEEKRQRNEDQSRVNEATREENARLDLDRSRLERRIASTRDKISSLEQRIATAKRGLSVSDPRAAQLQAAERSLVEASGNLEVAVAENDEDEVLRLLREVGLIEEEFKL